MAKKVKKKTKEKSKKNNKKMKIVDKRNNTSITPKNSLKTKGFHLTDIQNKIINHIKNNKSNLNYYYGDGKIVKYNKEIIEKVKESCLCRISDEFGTAVCINEKGYILTCSHAAPPFEEEESKESLYIFPSGEIVKTLTLEKDD